MSDLTEDEKIKAFVQALTLALQNIVGKSPGLAVNKHKPRKHKEADQGKTRRSGGVSEASKSKGTATTKR